MSELCSRRGFAWKKRIVRFRDWTFPYPGIFRAQGWRPDFSIASAGGKFRSVSENNQIFASKKRPEFLDALTIIPLRRESIFDSVHPSARGRPRSDARHRATCL